MKKNLLFFAILLFTISPVVFSQTDRFAYVITDVSREGAAWSCLRKIDLQSNTFSDILLSGTDATSPAFDAVTKKQLAAPFTDAKLGNAANAAFASGVAAIAYDKRNNRLYYTPMFIDQLRYVDLRTMKVFFLNGAGIEALKVKASDQSNIITRMAFASDGNGYALTNDGNHLVQFTTGKKPTVTDLGMLADDPENKGVSIHNSCSSFGGDMIADDDDNLYVFSARNHVFKINIETKVATHLGAVSGLPQNFTINGAAVGSDNRVLVVSATSNTALYAIDIKTWTAAVVNTAAPWRSSDLGNSNLLVTKNSGPPPALLSSLEENTGTRVQLYPNPVPNKQFTVQFNQLQGKYTLQVTDVLGREISRSVVNVAGKGQAQPVQLPATTKAGVYLVKIIDQASLQTVFSGKIIVQ
jgi:hypothetical protein